MLYFEANASALPQRAGWRDVHDRVEQLERNPQRAAALARARERLAAELHPPGTLAALRMSKGLSQSALAANMGTSQSKVSRIETGLDDPLHSTLLKLCAALDEPLEVVSAALQASQGPGND